MLRLPVDTLDDKCRSADRIETRGWSAITETSKAGTIEKYSAERKAEFLLSSAVGEADYNAALAEVRKLGIDPANVPHSKPPRSKP
jgi:hypothetical protein